MRFLKIKVMKRIQLNKTHFFLLIGQTVKNCPILQNNLGFSTKIFKHNNFCRFPPFIVGFHPHTFFESMI
ncbi:hypothetical protein COK00_01275 [Bacillus cereus]|uniref:Uncharacterized protein n=1 Tax=Bacillus cereus TaxID=1396 RepID=A0A2A8Y4J7_BACCE|nr:hypothetical protein CN455_21130 [Bacillus cereus]TXS01902.1 hypothetical protein DN390_03695 [Bacillus sp. SH7-1]PFB15822.1 hypothetical protein CN399_12205 [Bacillus cereus]PFB62445.1 hypothetical protein CN291_20805 [Bacillus cereus]PFC74680.1 hypothetical protein CN290_11840 [Bacillus cereus]